MRAATRRKNSRRCVDETVAMKFKSHGASAFQVRPKMLRYPIQSGSAAIRIGMRRIRAHFSRALFSRD
jgi:hypothetical protein